MAEKSNPEKNRIMKIAGICGILIPIVVLLCIGLAMSHSPWFRFTKHAFSDLGIEGVSAIFFNSGMILGGILALVFSLGLIKILKNKTGGYIFNLSSLALIGIGIFPETVYTLHFIVSAAFFVLLAISFLIIGLTIKRNQSERTMGILATLFAIIAICSTILLVPWEGIAIPEAVSCLPAFIWCMVYGVKMTFV
ncbi:putative membrane protein [Thermoplasmatales archaeon SCGC AB-540-F20]|nr:putative membrane protein [Thermoplasmatales archaeon SCGC AB-540-F20]